MPLPVPYFVYGYIYESDGSTPVDGATISVSATGGSDTDISDSNGKYQIEISQISSDGDTITVSTTYGVGASDTFTLDLADMVKQMDLTLSTAVVGFIIYGTRLLTIYGTKPMYIYEK